VLGLDLGHDRRADVLGVDVADAAHVLACQFGRVAAAEEGMAGVEQELRRRAGRLHEAVDLVRRLDDGAHVVVIDERQALRGGELGDGLDLCAEPRPLIGVQLGAVYQRPVVAAVDGVRGLAGDAHL
jgi:hypothetical protein